jgi:thiosulfate dehydrogenase
MPRPTTIAVTSLLAAAIVGAVLAGQRRAGAENAAAAPAAAPGQVEVKLCDNHTTTSVPADQPATKENGEKIAKALMDQWMRTNPNATAWIEEERSKHTIVDPADNSGLIGRGQGATYGQISAQDVATWREETLKLVVDGSTVFHSGDKLGSTIAVSCDMCHPDAANTHPETYPKFQPQLGRVAMLRDMINWCIQHPVRGQQLDPDDPNMRALEAYITAQRKGTPLDYGRR